MLRELLSLFRLPEPAAVAKRELAHAELELLRAQSALERAIAELSYQQARTARLRLFVAQSQAKVAIASAKGGPLSVVP